MKIEGQELIFDFIWKGQGTYQWREGESVFPSNDTVKQGKFLTSELSLDSFKELKPYRPLTDAPTLFLEFAKTDSTEQGVLDFACQYGHLGEDIPIVFDNKTVSSGESLSLWVKEIHTMRHVRDTWEMVRKENFEELNKRIRWVEGKSVSYDYRQGRQRERFKLLASRNLRPELLKKFYPDDPIGPAKAYIQQVVNKHLENRVTPRLLWESEKIEKLGLHIVPNNLIGALWLQFARAVDGNKEYRRCMNCRRFMDLSFNPQTQRKKRTNVKTCSNKCRRSLSRKRTRINDLRKRGYSLKKIAHQLELDVTLVRQLVQDKRT